MVSSLSHSRRSRRTSVPQWGLGGLHQVPFRSMGLGGGVFTFHGYKNEVLFRKFRIAPQTYITKRCKKVVRNIYDTKAVIDASQWHNKKLVSSTTLCCKDSKTTWREVCKFIKEEFRFLEPSVFWNFAIIWTKLNLQITSPHQSKPVISPDFSNVLTGGSKNRDYSTQINLKTCSPKVACPVWLLLSADSFCFI